MVIGDVSVSQFRTYPQIIQKIYLIIFCIFFRKILSNIPDILKNFE